MRIALPVFVALPDGRVEFIAPPFAAGRDIAGLVEMGAISKVPGTATRNVRSGPASLR